MLQSKPSLLKIIFAAVCLHTTDAHPLTLKAAMESEDRHYDSLFLAYNDFINSVKGISVKRDIDTKTIGIAAEELEQKTWKNSVQITAEGTYFDGFSMAQLYPQCIVEAQSASQPSAKAMDDFTKHNLNTCFFEKTRGTYGSPAPASIAMDLTVDALNPLGVTQVSYEPNVQHMREMVESSSFAYTELRATFDQVIEKFSSDLKLA